MNRHTIEWTCPEGDSKEILESLVKKYEEEANSGKVPADPRRCVFVTHRSMYGSFRKGFRYHLGILEERPWHGKDVFIKGFDKNDPRNPLFSIILFFLSETRQIEISNN